MLITYESGEVARVGDEVMQPVNGELHGLVVRVLPPDSPEAHLEGFPCGGIFIRWQGHRTPLDFWTTGALTEQPGCLWFVGRGTGFVPSEVPLLYRSAQAIEKGDVVMQPKAPDEPPGTMFASGEREGTVVDVLQPKSDEAASAGHPDGGIFVEWDERDGDPARHFMPPDMIVAPARLFLCVRAAEADSLLRYPNGRIVYQGDAVEERGDGQDGVRRGRVVKSAEPEAIHQGGAAFGGVFIVSWEGEDGMSTHPAADISGPKACVFLVGRNPPG